MFKLDLEKKEESEIKLPASTGSQKKQENSRKKFYFCFTDYARAFDWVDHHKLFSSVQLFSCVRFFPTSWTAAHQDSQSITNFRSCSLSWWYYPTISSSVIPFSSHLQTFSASGSFQMSQFFTLGGQTKLSFSFNTSPSKEHSILISCTMDWLNLLAVQGTPKSLLKHQTSKAPIISAQLSLYSNSNIHTWLLVKTALTR